MISRKTGRIITLPDNRNLGSWTQAAKWAAREAGAEVIAKPTPITVTATFTFLPPKTTKRAAPTVKPDIDKLVRAVLDALTGIAYEDDAQVTSILAMKNYGPYEQCQVSVAW
jgi:crossover junction endodeoxyribonuclease RusA